MFGVIDPSRKPLSIPSRFVPYLEKHRIYELFYELTNELIIEKPDDHIYFLQQCLHHASRKLDVSRIILLTFPGFDCKKLAESLHHELGVRSISIEDIHKFNTLNKSEDKCGDSNVIASSLRKMLKSIRLVDDFGWVLIDFPRTKNEVLSLQRSGIIPTHVIEIMDTALGACVEVNKQHSLFECFKKSTRSEKENYNRNITEIRKAYADILIQVEIGGRSMEDLGRDCAKLAKVKKHYGTPSMFRIILIGSPGSGCQKLAEYLSQRFKIVHVNFKNILEQLRLQKIPMGDIRKLELKLGTIPNAEIRIQIIEKRILQKDCLSKGWILTGYPITVEDFKFFDHIATPPNRIFFVDVDEDTCRERLISRQINVNAGSGYNLISESIEEHINYDLNISPRDYPSIVEKKICEYKENVNELKNYAGDSALMIDGNLDEKKVREKIETYLMKPAPITPPRISQTLPEIDPIQIEFDPDAETDF